MKQPTERALQRHEVAPANQGDNGEGKTWGIFSPVLKYFSAEEEQAAIAAGLVPNNYTMQHSNSPSSSSSSSYNTVPQLQSPPNGRNNTVMMPNSPQASTTHLGRNNSTTSSTTTVVTSQTVNNLAQRTTNLTLYSNTTTSSNDNNTVSNTVVASSLTQLSSPNNNGSSTPNNSAVTVRNQPAPQPEPEEEDDYEYEYEEFNPYLFIKLLPPYSSVAPKTPRIVLPKKSKKAPEISLVLDLDETLVHCSVDPIPDADVTFPVTFNGCNYMVYVRKRPHLDKFFASILGKFEVTIFTASQQVYAERLLNLLDPEGIYIHHRLYRDSCLPVEGNYLKDLNVLGRDLTKTVLVDNSPHAFGYQLDNGIPIESWFEDRNDTELLKLSAFLHQLLGQHDVRPLVRDKFRVHRLVEDASRRANISAF